MKLQIACFFHWLLYLILSQVIFFVMFPSPPPSDMIQTNLTTEMKRLVRRRPVLISQAEVQKVW